MKIAIIPARGGSKRIPRKNVRLFHEKPIIVWSIEAALSSGCFDRVIVSTDDPIIADIALHAGAEVPFMRPAELSDDMTGTMAVISHAIKWLNSASTSVQNGESSITHVCCIYATAPFINDEDIKRGFIALTAGENDYALAVTNFDFPIQRAVVVNQQNQLNMLQPKHFMTRSQDLPMAFHDAGQFCWGTVDAWLREKSIFSAPTVAVIIPSYRVQDVDTEDDWIRAELMFKASYAMKSL
ncbi:pseudaminic acid cytidylyltransferase [Shewanella sp. ULN5]|uniref:pseudaminic acid cytidylyltransferase n=1 Tax=Shewanella sp. ULN5 TaxID=2994678 RepID=UPI00273ECE34|nr:pseudaminic acid cytidylyltransferase [Shewanella sp. ULN5]MDP5144997.1 pseudaminic acid cytidylyltransferase [Shewanella sp. ULN5]